MENKSNCHTTSEMRLIDANALSDKVDESKHNNPHPQGLIRVNHRNEHDHFLRMIMDAPTVDAVEVVRCKDCKHFVQGEPYDPCECMKWMVKWGVAYTTPDGYCHNAEVKDK